MFSNFTPNFASNFLPNFAEDIAGNVDGVGDVNNIYPSLDLFFAYDKAFEVDVANPGGCLVSARRGPDARFSRASGRTFTDSDGLVKWAAENLLLNSATLATQSKTLDATPYTLSFYGTGTVTLSGGHVAAVVGTGTTRKTYTFTPTAGSTTFTVTGSVTEGQLSRSPCQYLPTTSAPVYGPAFEHDPVTGVCLGLSRWEQRTNLLLNSSNLSGAGWNYSVVPSYIPAIGATTGIGPDGTTGSISTISYPVVDVATHSFVYQIATTPIQGSVSESVWVRVASGTATIYANIIDSAAVPAGSNFVAGEPEVVTTEWRRISTAGNVSGGSSAVFSLGFDTRCDAGQVNAAPFVLQVWGSQLEQGAPSSYIPTTTAPVVRSADVCSIDGADFAGFYNQSEGTYAAHLNATPGISNVAASFDNGSYAKRIQTLISSPNNVGLYVADTSEQVNLNINSPALADESTHAVAWRVNDFAGCTNGGAIFTDLSATIPTVDRLNIGADAMGSFPLNGNIARLTYWPKRLSNSKIINLTL